MEAVILDGKKISTEVKDEVREETAALLARGVKVHLTVIQVGEDPASTVYVRNKMRACEYTGIASETLHLPDTITEENLLSTVEKLNRDPSVNGILVQLPLPEGMDEDKVTRAIDPRKDVDGFHPENVGGLSIGLPGVLPCTPAGIIEILHRYGIETDGKECVVVGRSNIVGKPMAMLMLRENATVTVAHSHTRNLADITKRADILISAIGKPKFFTKEYVKEGAVVIDCGMDRDENGKLCGDVDTADVRPFVSAITPVPGGVGPMTVAMLMKNCLEAAKRQNGISGTGDEA